jgi:hypothetical protein
MTLYVVLSCLFLVSSSKKYYDLTPTILPIQCFNNIYLDKILDSLRYVESTNGKYTLNINYKHGKEISRDEGDYQHNNKNAILFANLYNDGKRYNPYNNEVARRISRQYLVDNYKISGNWFDALVMYNCGYFKWLRGAPHKSFLFAERIMRRIR